jgi:hypothetical protein
MRKRREPNSDKYDTVYRFRCFKDLKDRATKVAKARGTGDASDVGREGVIKLVVSEEKRLGLARTK